MIYGFIHIINKTINKIINATIGEMDFFLILFKRGNETKNTMKELGDR